MIFPYFIRQRTSRMVCTNGQMAHKLYQKYLAKEIDLPETVLPSTSPANAAWSLERLTEAWKIIRSI